MALPTTTAASSTSLHGGSSSSNVCMLDEHMNESSSSSSSSMSPTAETVAASAPSSSTSSLTSARTASLQSLIRTEEASLRTQDWAAVKMIPLASFQNSVWREKVAQWFYDLVDHLNEPRQLVYVAVSILDRYLAITRCGDHLDRWRYKRTSIAALFVTVRLVGTSPIDLPYLLRLTGDTSEDLPVSVHDILSTGKLILQTMSWEHRILTPFHFIQSLLTKLRPHVPCPVEFIAILESTVYLSELQVFDTYFMAWQPSCLAAVAVIQAIEQSVPSVARQSHIRSVVVKEFRGCVDHNGSSLEDAVLRLQTLYRQSADAGIGSHDVHNDDTSDPRQPAVIPDDDIDHSDV